jgi:hypothetical protein
MITDGKIFGLLIVAALVASFTIGGCGSTPEGRANKAAGKQSSPAAGRIISKWHEGGLYRMTLKRKGEKSHTINVTAAAWNRCHVDRWYPTCK